MIRDLFLLAALLTSTLAAACRTGASGGAAEERASEPVAPAAEGFGDAHARGDGFDWEQSGALDLLELLKEYPVLYCVEEDHEGWVKEADLAGLVELLDSSEPCANVISSRSSFIDFEPSTIGNEAAYLIEGYRRGKYPPRLNSTRPRPDVDEIRAWWRERERR